MKSSKYPYWGMCDVYGCHNENCNGGGCWKETGYWQVCSEHSRMFRGGKPQPRMKPNAIKREKLRQADGCLPANINTKYL